MPPRRKPPLGVPERADRPRERCR